MTETGKKKKGEMHSTPKEVLNKDLQLRGLLMEGNGDTCPEGVQHTLGVGVGEQPNRGTTEFLKSFLQSFLGDFQHFSQRCLDY